MLALADIDKLVIDSPELGCALYVPGLPGGSNKVHDRSPYSNAGTITGATWKRLPSGLWCLSFDGLDDKIPIPDAASITDVFGGGGTVEFWLNAASDGQAGSGRFYTKGSLAFLAVGESAGKIKALFELPWSGDNGKWSSINTIITLNTWSQVVLTYNSDSPDNDPTVYINTTAYTVGSGLTEDATPTGTRTSDSGNDLVMGNTVATDRTLDGSIALFRAYNRTLSALEIQNHFNREKHLFGVW